jgi:hypothetical protein
MSGPLTSGLQGRPAASRAPELRAERLAVGIPPLTRRVITGPLPILMIGPACGASGLVGIRRNAV